jgi:hypothetical protein
MHAQKPLTAAALLRRRRRRSLCAACPHKPPRRSGGKQQKPTCLFLLGRWMCQGMDRNVGESQSLRRFL